MVNPARTVVVDASVAVKWHLLDEDYVAESARLLTEFARGETELIAPAHINYEVASSVTVATTGRSPRLSLEQGRDAINEFLALGIRTVPDPELVMSAYELAHRHGCAFYDALYLALAEQLQLDLVVADHRLYQRVGQLPGVIWIGDYTNPPAL